MPKDYWNPLRQIDERGLLLPLGIGAVVVSVLIVGALFIPDEADPALRNALWGGAIGFVATFIILMLALWILQMREGQAGSSVSEAPKAPVPLEPLPPYQPIRQEPLITIQIPARTMVVVVVSLALLTMFYFRVLRGNRGDDA